MEKPGMGTCIVGRGAINSKGPQGTFLGALHAFKAAGKKLPVNLVLVCEGEEEIASPHFREIVFRPDVEAALKKCEGIFIPEAAQGPDGTVEISLGAKGVVELELFPAARSGAAGPPRTYIPAWKRRSTARCGILSRRSTPWLPPMDIRLRLPASSTL